MSLAMSELMEAEGEVILCDSNKRKFDDTELIVKRCKIESPTTSPQSSTTASTYIETDQNSENLSDIGDSETSDSSEPIVQPTTSTAQQSKPQPRPQHGDASETNGNSSNQNDNEHESAERTVSSPNYGQIVNRREFRRAGPYVIGLKLGHSPVDSIVQYLAKKENTNEFVQLKILMLNNNTATETQMQDERQGKMLLHTEFSLLSLLKEEPGVIQHHGMFSDMALEEVTADNFDNNNFYTGQMRKRLVLVLDCVSPHDFDPNSAAYVNLQQYLINRRKLTEMEALKIFYEIITVVERLHNRNIIHRDLKLGNIVLNKHSNKITIVNFCLGKYLLNENDKLYDQRGSPAYISPDVLCGKPYKGKPSDMWALGVVLFMMLYRQFPFFESTPNALFKKIKAAEYFIPMNSEVSKDAEQIIRGLLQVNPEKRLTASQVRDRLRAIIDSTKNARNIDRLVPQMDSMDDLAVPTRITFTKSDKWTTENSLNDNDQVVPSMSVSTAPILNSSSRKRRRSTDKIFSELSQRGIPVEHIDRDADKIDLSADQLRQLFEGSRRRFETSNSTASAAQVVAPSPSPLPTSSSNRPAQSTPSIISFSDLYSSQSRPTVSSLLRSVPNSLRITQRSPNTNTENETGHRGGATGRTSPVVLNNSFSSRNRNRMQSPISSSFRSPSNANGPNLESSRSNNSPASDLRRMLGLNQSQPITLPHLQQYIMTRSQQNSVQLRHYMRLLRRGRPHIANIRNDRSDQDEW